MKLYIRDKRVSDLVVDAIMDQCKKEISFKSSLTVRGMLIVTVDSKQVVLYLFCFDDKLMIERHILLIL